ncbi:MAG: hypothetical protein HC879_06315 [Leptolyngbyaceae cyanobacterium SL_5_9]|nr:hypothetical protein [Leptolyngbyaceae cyanobacterium SL_5_9]NJO76895.1 hypothetical protein [Leptolyngbyaceae cyanobacterium RM1_406_9]
MQLTRVVEKEHQFLSSLMLNAYDEALVSKLDIQLMEMLSGLVIQDRKLTHYLLVYQAEDDKSEFLASAGYTLQNWQLLKRDILNAMAEAEVVEAVPTDWGTRFKVKAQWDGLNGQKLKVIII